MHTADVPQLQTELSLPARLGAVAALVLLVGLGFWASLVPISAAVVARGQIDVRGKPIVVQSFEGGTIAALPVRSGDQVSKGDLLVQLDPTLLQASLEVAQARLGAALALRARLMSEHQGLPAPRFDIPALPFALPDLSAEEEGQRRIFAARRALFDGRAAQLAEAEVQITAQLQGLAGQIRAKRDQIATLRLQIDNARTLADQGLARSNQVLDLQRIEAEILGQIAGLDSSAAQAAGSLQEARISELQARREVAEQVATELRAANAEIEELIPQILNTTARLTQLSIRAPIDGVVHEMEATLGGVIAPGATVLQVIGQEQGLVFALRVDPGQADQLEIGQPARLVIAALPREAPQLAGRLERIAPTTSTDQMSGQIYYSAEVEVPAAELALLDGYALRPGLPVEGYLERPARSALAYLLDPLARHLDHAFREE